MPERPENFDAADTDPEATLVTPRFDADDARRAHPVVPLSEAPGPAPYVSARATRTFARRRAWTPALLAVALLAVAAVGGAVATKFMQGPRAERTQELIQPEQPQSAPAQTAEAPTQQQPLNHTAAEAPREDTPAAKASTRKRRARAVAAGAAPEEFDEEVDGDRRGKGRERRRGRDDDELDKETRKAVKRPKKNAPRLVDVLTNP